MGFSAPAVKNSTDAHLERHFLLFEDDQGMGDLVSGDKLK